MFYVVIVYLNKMTEEERIKIPTEEEFIEEGNKEAEDSLMEKKNMMDKDKKDTITIIICILIILGILAGIFIFPSDTQKCKSYMKVNSPYEQLTTIRIIKGNCVVYPHSMDQSYSVPMKEVKEWLKS